MTPGRGYYYVNKSGVARTLVLAGQVDNATLYDSVLISAPAVDGGTFNNPVSWRDTRDRDRDDLNLLANNYGGTGGFRGANTSQFSDRTIRQADGQFFWRRSSDNSWQGAVLTNVNPGQAYWIQNRHGTHNWSYKYDYSGASADVAGPPAVSSTRNAPKTPDVFKTPNAPVTKTSTVPVTKTETKASAPTKAAK
jgi:hypothetical protein